MIGWLRWLLRRRPPWDIDTTPTVPVPPERSAPVDLVTPLKDAGIPPWGPGVEPPERGDDPRLDPYERVLPMDVQVSAEETINASFGLPEVWRCPCGGRPFVTQKTCPRCGRKQGERWS